MIYTTTFNPTLDYILQLQNFKTGEINRSEKEYILPGGKGINVSIVLKELKINSTALGFIAGFVGDEIEKRVKEHGIATDFIKVKDGVSRINVKIATKEDETAINSNGPNIDMSYIKVLYEKVEKMQNGDTLVLSGSVPQSFKKDVYEKICEKVEEKNVRIIVDATGDLLLKTLKYHPFLIKPNQSELEEIFETKIENQDEAVEYAKKLQEKGAKNVLVSMGNLGAVLVDEDGATYRVKAEKTEKMISTVGAGDSMVAGFIAGYELFKDYGKALKMGVATATATTSSMFLATKDEIYKLLTNIL